MAQADSASAAAQIPEEAPLCPGCGYDLRGTVGDRCSECGETFDWASLASSGIPWARRKEIGRIRAYVKTVWLITIGSRRLAHEASRAQDMADARIFRRVTAGIVAIVLGGLFAGVAWKLEGLQFLAVPTQAMMGRPAASGQWMFDLAVPWSAGATIPIVLPVVLCMLAAHVTGVQRRVFQDRNVLPKRQERLDALACYTVAPLTWLLPAGACAFSSPHAKWEASVGHVSFHVPGVLGWFVAVVVVVLSGIRIMSSLRRNEGGGSGRRLGRVVVLLWLVAAVLGILVMLALLSIGTRSVGSNTVFFVFAAVLTATAVGACYLRVGQWVVRARHVGWDYGLLVLIRLAGLWLIGLLFWLGFVPWCVGFLWIVVDSFL